MQSPSNSTGNSLPDARLLAFAKRGAWTVAFGFVFATFVWAIRPQSYAVNLAYTICISVSCWLLIDCTRLAVVRWLLQRNIGDAKTSSGWPGLAWMLPIVGIGSVLGYALGTEIANTLLGKHTPGPFNASGREVATILAFALVPGAVITYIFLARGTIAAKELLVQQAERQAAEQRLKLLESQLEPHMLFNTLANLRALIGVDPPRAQAMLDQLIAFLRASLAGSRTQTHTLAVEFERLRDYLALMQIRMGPRLATRFELAAGVANARVPALLLQPIVENSIKHGIEPQVDGGCIEIVAQRDGDVLVLRVSDTGAGLGTAASSVQSRHAADDRLGPDRGFDIDGRFGLSHVRERLATLYGSRASFDLTPNEDAAGGTLATIRMPYEAGPEAAP